MVLNTPLSYRDGIGYYNKDETRALHSPEAQESTNSAAAVTNSSLRA